MKKPGINPYLPFWEYIPDGEPHIFSGRVYVYGSHDRFGGHAFCLNDYVCWSAPENDLADWRYEGVIYGRSDDPRNQDGEMCLYAPDVTRGPDGKYYLYYVLNGLQIMSVAVCDTPAGRYRFYGYVKYEDGTLLGEALGDEPQFDPGVLTEGENTYLYSGFCPAPVKDRTGARMAVLGPDMLTIRRAPVTVVPSASHAAGSGFEGHEFFEASSIRRIEDTYYFVYSSVLSHELCYATATAPEGPFTYGGTIVSNGDIGIGSYKPADKNAYFIGNDHGGLVQAAGQWYIFHHRHTNGSSFSRQGCLESVRILPDGSIPQVEMTSCGANGGPLPGRGEYPAYMACNLMLTQAVQCNEQHGQSPFPYITQDGPDGNEEPAYIANMTPGVVAGFKYFDCKGVKRIRVKVRGNFAYGAVFTVSTAWDGEPLGGIPLGKSNEWREYTAGIVLPDGVHALYFMLTGYGIISFASFSLE